MAYSRPGAANENRVVEIACLAILERLQKHHSLLAGTFANQTRIRRLAVWPPSDHVGGQSCATVDLYGKLQVKLNPYQVCV